MPNYLYRIIMLAAPLLTGSGQANDNPRALPADGKGPVHRYHKPPDEVLQKTLSPLQYRVTQHKATEPAFDNAYWNEHQEGIYVDVVSGEPLFSSQDKYDSGSGWPSFRRPLVAGNIVEQKDFKLLLPRTEVLSRHGGSHLGHRFNDGPANGPRYCINSAALRFIPVAELEAAGYGEYLRLFERPHP